jgi:hypothetical protein
LAEKFWVALAVFALASSAAVPISVTALGDLVRARYRVPAVDLDLE